MFGKQPLGPPEAGEGLRLGLAMIVAAEAAQHHVQGALAVLAQALQVEESLLEVLATPLDSQEDLEEKHGVSVILMAQVQELQARQDSQQSREVLLHILLQFSGVETCVAANCSCLSTRVTTSSTSRCSASSLPQREATPMKMM